jgi:AcrR family transcriptional regulator
MAAPITREQQAQETRRRLVDTALELFAEHGFDGTSMKALARAAGVAQGLVYHYFTGKEALLWAVLETHSFAPDLALLLAEAADRPAREALLRVCRRFDAVLTERRALLRLLVREAPVNPEVALLWRRLIREGGESLCRFLEARAEAGELRRHDPRTALRMLLFPILMLHVLQDAETAADGFIEEAVDTLLAGLIPEEVLPCPREH